MNLLNLTIKNFRNIVDANLELSPDCNIFCGGNGAGKTSILEAIYYLGIGRSFRSHLFRRIINYDAVKFALFTEVQQGANIIPLGIERSNDGYCKIRMAGEDVNSLAELVKLLPIQLVTQAGYELFNNGAKLRRRFIDWGVFHVEHSFIPLWRRVNRALKQRNSALKTAHRAQHIRIWDDELVALSLALHKLREKYITEVLPIIYNLLTKLLDGFEVTISYYAGWDLNKNLYEILTDNLEADRKVGFTQYGPHRADLRFYIGKIPSQHILSRGQQKLFFFALLLAQGMLLRQSADKRCVYLIDDLASELDMERKKIIISLLEELKAQVFVTCLDPKNAQLFLLNNAKMFHVERGIIT